MKYIWCAIGMLSFNKRIVYVKSFCVSIHIVLVHIFSFDLRYYWTFRHEDDQICNGLIVKRQKSKKGLVSKWNALIYVHTHSKLKMPGSDLSYINPTACVPDGVSIEISQVKSRLMIFCCHVFCIFISGGLQSACHSWSEEWLQKQARILTDCIKYGPLV